MNKTKTFLIENKNIISFALVALLTFSTYKVTMYFPGELASMAGFPIFFYVLVNVFWEESWKLLFYKLSGTYCSIIGFAIVELIFYMLSYPDDNFTILLLTRLAVIGGHLIFSWFTINKNIAWGVAIHTAWNMTAWTHFQYSHQLQVFVVISGFWFLFAVITSLVEIEPKQITI